MERVTGEGYTVRDEELRDLLTSSNATWVKSVGRIARAGHKQTQENMKLLL
jgi:hypothetical protein